jgi:hypothetical protein
MPIVLEPDLRLDGDAWRAAEIVIVIDGLDRRI